MKRKIGRDFVEQKHIQQLVSNLSSVMRKHLCGFNASKSLVRVDIRCLVRIVHGILLGNNIQQVYDALETRFVSADGAESCVAVLQQH